MKLTDVEACVMKEHVGYILANDRHGHYEFIAHYEGNEHSSYKLWCLVPQGAVRYASKREAETIAARESRFDGDIFVCELIDNGSCWLVEPGETAAA